jgi:hypothetical protein
MGFARYEDVATSLAATLRVMGLGAPSLFVGNASDRTAIQLVELANTAGRELMDELKGQVLEREFTINTQIGVANYDLPEDFNGFVSDSQWNRTTRLPALGSLQEFEWQALKARQLAGTTFTVLFRIEDDQIVFYNEPQTVQTIVMPYMSRAWVRSADDSLHDTLQADTDTILYDAILFQTKLRLAFMDAKGFDTSKIQAKYADVLEAAKNKDAPARTLSLSPRSEYPYLGVLNIPETGYGS